MALFHPGKPRIYAGRTKPRPKPWVAPKCKVHDCEAPAEHLGYGFYRALCSHHRYENRVGRKVKPKSKIKTKYKLSSLPCKRCNWYEGPTDTHRIIPGHKGGKYNRENVIPLCLNCHRLVTLGLIELDNEVRELRQ